MQIKKKTNKQNTMAFVTGLGVASIKEFSDYKK